MTTFAGSSNLSGSTDDTGSAARFSYPDGIGVDSNGNVYVADSGNNTIRKITSAGVVTTLAGTAGTSGSADGNGSAARFNSPAGLAVDGAGNIYVADRNNNSIRKVTSAGVVTTVVGDGSTMVDANAFLPAKLNSPIGLAIGVGKLFMTSEHTVLSVPLNP